VTGSEHPVETPLQHEMMAAFDVTALLDFGYPETSFRDPMEARWRAEAVTADKFTSTAIAEKVRFMASLEPYSNVDDVYDALQSYWNTHRKRSRGRVLSDGLVKARRVSAE
jgi:hypothetical protein